VGEPSPLERQEGGNPQGNQPQKLISPGSSRALCCEKTRALVFFPELLIVEYLGYLAETRQDIGEMTGSVAYYLANRAIILTNDT